jgi:hypothetical protein
VSVSCSVSRSVFVLHRLSHLFRDHAPSKLTQLVSCFSIAIDTFCGKLQVVIRFVLNNEACESLFLFFPVVAYERIFCLFFLHKIIFMI